MVNHPSTNKGSAQLGDKLATYLLQVWCRNHYTPKPPIPHLFFCWLPTCIFIQEYVRNL